MLDAAFAKKERAYWRKRRNERAIVFDVVTVPQDLRTIKTNGVIVPFADSDQGTITSPLETAGVAKVQPRLPRRVGQHTGEVLREISLDEAAIAQLRGSGAFGKGV